jgi:23S rRNA pseudouridine955/2504/2580 synthase
MNDYVQNSVQKVTITSNNDGQRLDNFLLTYLKGVPRSHVYHIIRTGQVRINSKRCKPKVRLVEHDLLRIPPIKSQEDVEIKVDAGLAAHLQNSIIYEDDYIIALNKPAGLAVHAGSGVSAGIIEIMRTLYGKDLELVHRLDKDTSGCLLIAKQSSIVRRFHQMLREQQLTKIYKLVTCGRWPRHIKTVTTGIRKILTPSGESIMQVHEEGAIARTQFQLEQYYPQASLLTANLITGKTHQIRVHAAHQGFPIIGDNKYGNYQENKNLAELGLKKMMLHAWQVKFIHPFTEAQINITAPLSEHFRSQLKLLTASNEVET